MVEQTLNNAFQNLDTIFPGVEITDDFLYKITNPFLKFYFLKFYEGSKKPENTFTEIPPDPISFKFESFNNLLIYPWLGRRQEIINTVPLYIASLQYDTDLAISSQEKDIRRFKANLIKKHGIEAKSIIFHDHSKRGPNIEETMIQTLLALTISKYGYFTLHELFTKLPGVDGTPDIVALKDEELSNLLLKFGIPNPLPLCFYSNLEWSKSINKDSLIPCEVTNLSVIEVKESANFDGYKKNDQLHKYTGANQNGIRLFHKAYGCSALIKRTNETIFNLDDIMCYNKRKSKYGYMYFNSSGFHINDDPLERDGKLESRSSKENASRMIAKIRRLVVHLLLCNLTLAQIIDIFGSDGNNLYDLINNINASDPLENITKILEIWKEGSP